MKIVLLGANGQLGWELQRSLAPLGELHALDRRSADLAQLEQQWDQLAQREDHKAFAERVEPLVVSGSTRWEILRPTA